MSAVLRSGTLLPRDGAFNSFQFLNNYLYLLSLLVIGVFFEISLRYDGISLIIR